jgi:hypothetical protein
MTDWLRRKEAAIYLTAIGCPVSARTLERMASNSNSGHGPAFHRRGWKSVVYHKRDLDKWAKEQSRRIE